MLDLTNPDSDASENGNSKYADSSDGQGVGTSRKPEVDKFTLEERRKDLADLAIWVGYLIFSFGLISYLSHFSVKWSERN